MSSLVLSEEIVSHASSTTNLSNFHTQWKKHLANEMLFRNVIDANHSRAAFISSNKQVHEQKAKIEELQEYLKVIEADVDSLNEYKLASQRIFYELKDKVIAKPSQSDADIVFGLAPNVLSPILLEAGEISSLEANIERATNLAAFLSQRMDLEGKLSALTLKRREENQQRYSLHYKLEAIKKYERDLARLDQACAESEESWNAVFSRNIGQN